MEEKDRVATENDAFSSALNGILSNPEMMSMISSMADKLKGGSAPTEQPPSPPAEEIHTAKTPEEAPSLPAMSELSGALGALSPMLGGLFKGAGGDDNRACLLRALKPYLSKNRCDAIDHIITISKLSYLFKSHS